MNSEDLIVVKGYHLVGKTVVEVDVPMIADYPLGADPRDLGRAALESFAA